MELNRRQAWIGLGAVLAFAAAILGFRLWAFGIWDPWELNVADAARGVADGRPRDAGAAGAPFQLGLWLISLGFRVGGVHEWSGRLPMALAGLGVLGAAYALVSRFAGARGGVYAALIAGTSPLFLFNARQMLGDAPVFFAQTATFAAAALAIYRPSSEPSRAKAMTGMWLGFAVLAAGLAVLARGALLGALPPFLALAGTSALDGTLWDVRNDRRKAGAAWAVVAIGIGLLGAVAFAVFSDQADYSYFTGGTPRGGTPPSFEAAIEDVFHAFAPWSALLPLALGNLLAPDSGRSREEGSFRIAIVLWATAGYAAQTLFSSRYGAAPFVPVVALAAAVALFLRDVEKSGSSWGTAAVIGALFAGLLLRDYALYPKSPIDGLAVNDLQVPELFGAASAPAEAHKTASPFDTRVPWAVVLGLFAAASFLSLAIAPREGRPFEPFASVRFVRAQWNKGLGFKAWIALFAVLFGSVLCGALYLARMEPGTAQGPLASIATIPVITWSRRLAIVTAALPVAVLAVQFVLFAYERLGAFRFAPLLLAGALAGGYAAQGFLPMLSEHLSPREIYDAYNAHAGRGETLIEYRVGGRAAAYYAHGEVREVTSQPELINALVSARRTWAAFPTEELPAINREFRQRTGKNLFVADARSARVMLAANQPVRGVSDQNFIAGALLDRMPSPQFPVHANFDHKLELIGYDLTLPHDGYVGAGESVTVTWYWRAVEPLPGGYKIFLHVDGLGNRLNGDHDPVRDKYPTRLWDRGDIVRDVQELQVPVNYRPGAYTMFIGLYAGESRLEVVEGPEDDSNRVRAGVLEVR